MKIIRQRGTAPVMTVLIVTSLWLQGSIGFASQGCCSTHGGVVGCASGKLQCNDGTLSPTCSCQEGAISSSSQAQDKLALMEAGTPEVKPNVIPTPVPSPSNTADIIPPREETHLGDQIPEVKPQKPGDFPPPQQPPKPNVTPTNPLENPAYHSSNESPVAEPTVESIPSESELKGRSAEEIEQLLKERGFEGESTRDGEAAGQRFPNPNKPGEQVRIMKGKPNDPNPVKRGPYARISANGKVSEPIPLKGNPTLQERSK